MQNMFKQNERNAIARYVRATYTGATPAQLRVVSTLPCNAVATAKRAMLHRTRTIAGLTELAATAHMQRAPFQSETEFQNELLAMRHYAHTAQVALESHA